MNKGKALWILNSDIVIKEEEGEGILFDPRSNEIKILNNVGKTICELCNGERLLEDIVDAIIEKYEVHDHYNDLKMDIANFLDKLEKRNIVEKRLS